MEQVKINWEEEAGKLKSFSELDQKEWFNAEAGQHKIKFLKEGNTYSATLKDGSPIEKVRFEVEVKGKEYNFGVPKGRTEASLWGQLAIVAQRNGSLEGQEITLLVKSDGKKRNYVVLEAMDEKPKEETVK